MGNRHIYGLRLLLALLVGWFATVSAAEATVLGALSPSQFKTMLDEHQVAADVVLLDIRTPKEFADGHIQGAVMIDYYASDFVDRLKTLDLQKTYLIYCRSGNRTGRSLAIFEKLGFSRVYHLETGIIGWAQKGLPLVRTSG